MNGLQACIYKLVNKTSLTVTSNGQIKSANASLFKYFVFEREDKCEQFEFDNTSDFKKILVFTSL